MPYIDHASEPEHGDKRALPTAENPSQAATGAGQIITPTRQAWRLTGRLEALADVAILLTVMAAPQVAGWMTGSGRMADAELRGGAMLAANAVMWASITLLALWLVVKSGQPLESIGFTCGNFALEFGVAMVTVAAMFVSVITVALFATVVAGRSIEELSGPVRHLVAMFGKPSLAEILAVALTAAVAEEIVFRGFLLTRLRIVFGNWPTAIIISAAVFAVPHIWQGWWAVVQIFPIGLILGVAFVLRRSLVPVMLAHFSFNFCQMMLLRFLADNPVLWRAAGA